MRALAKLVVLALVYSLVRMGEGATGRCGERLERALDMMQQRTKSTSRRRYDHDEPDMVFYQRLSSAPIDVSVTKMMVEIPSSKASTARSSSSSSWSSEGSWARVERCAYEPTSSSVRTRVAFSELSVSGLVQLSAAAGAAWSFSSPSSGASERRSYAAAGPGQRPAAESCRMSLRLRRAGMEFHTSPIARARGQMRIRTESSFLEPKFASIYAYGCKPVFLQPREAADTSSPTLEALLASNDSLVLDDSEPRQAAPSSAKARQLQLLFGNRYHEDGPDGLMQDVGADLGNDEQRLELEGDGANNRLGYQQQSDKAGEELLDSLWRSRGEIAREMEEVLLSSASQAVTHYIEKQLHPAIKETLMLSMGYTISYG